MLRQTRVISVLRTFTKNEHKEFRKFLKSPFFVSRKNILDLYDLIARNYLYKDFRSIDASFLYSELFPEEFKVRGYSDSTMRFMYHSLFKASQEFLAVRKFMGKKMLANEVLREELLERELYDLFDLNVSLAEKMLADGKNKDSANYLLRYNLEQDKVNIYNILLGRKIKKGKNKKIYNFAESAQNLFNYFISEMAGFVDNYDKYCRSKNIPVNAELVECMYSSLNSESLEKFQKTLSGKVNIDVYKIYKAQHLAFTFMEDDEHYKIYKNLLLDNVFSLEIDLKNYFFSRLIDYCVLKRRMKPDNKIYIDESLSVYKLVVENGLYRHSKNKSLPIELFSNVVIVGIRAEQLDWTDDFVEKFKTKLHKDMRSDSYHYGKARILFEKKDFQKTIEHLNNIKDEYYLYAVLKKAYFIMSLFELQNYEDCIMQMDSFRHYLNNVDHVTEKR
jgi:hypothetical protein